MFGCVGSKIGHVVMIQVTLFRLQSCDYDSGSDHVITAAMHPWIPALVTS